MKVDLLALRTLIEQEITRLEKEESRLQQHLQHIVAVEKIAEATKSRLHIVEKSPEPTGTEEVASDNPGRWFQKV
jgi:hypothetical protein